MGHVKIHVPQRHLVLDSLQFLAAKRHRSWLFDVRRIPRVFEDFSWIDVLVCQNLVPLVNIKIAGKWMFIPLKMVLIGIDPYPCC